MASMKGISLVFTCVLLSLNTVWSSDIAVLEYLLNAKLTSWRQSVTQQIKDEVLQEILASLETRTKTLRYRYQTMKIELQETKYRLTSLEAENLSLKDVILNLQNNGKTCRSPTSTAATCAGGNGGIKLAIGEGSSGDIHLIDPKTEARWKVTSSKGIRGMVYHPITKILYLLTAHRNNAIRSVNAFLNTEQILKKCPRQCLAIGLDAKENILYFIENSRNGKNSYVLRMYLNTTEINKKPFLKYSRNLSPSTLAVDDINKHVFVVLRGKGVIEQVDYTGKKVGEILVDPAIEDRSITFNMALNKLDKILYYSVDDGLWRKRLGTDDDPELVSVSNLAKLSGLVFVNNQLLVSYMSNSRIDVLSEKGFKKLVDLGNSGNSDSKHICLFD